MPELQEYMYCSQQICIPPTFPYILRQYAKAAIRTQPNDLLRWSTAYFRCLALNLPPPVKARLEYPIPRDYQGFTPGWLRVLLYQLGLTATVPFKILWDRWMGAALKHDTLIELLCLGGFDDPDAIPWFQFIGLCASHLTDSLTETMILFCEILTEEPEGGSAMVPLEPFLDVYSFLTKIDASEPQTLLNVHFTDSALGLHPDAPKVKPPTPPPEVISVGEEPSVESIEIDEGPVIEETVVEDLSAVISCPDIAADDFKGDDDELKLLQEDTPTEGTPEPTESEPTEKQEEIASLAPTEDVAEDAESKSESGSKSSSDSELTDKESTESIPEKQQGAKDKEGEDDEEKEDSNEIGGSAETIVGIENMPERQGSKEEVAGGTHHATEEEKEEEEEEGFGYAFDDEFEKFKEAMMLPRTKSEEEKIERYEEYVRESLEEAAKAALIKDEEPAEEVEEKKAEEIYVEAVPGIGPIVPAALVNAVVTYMKTVSKDQHGMVMPRNIRHYNCPPLEVLN